MDQLQYEAGNRRQGRRAAGNFTASNGADKLMAGKLKDQFAESFPKAAIDNIRWYPAVPAGIEEIEGKVLDRLKAANLVSCPARDASLGPLRLRSLAKSRTGWSPDLDIVRVTKRFGAHVAVDDVSLDVAHGSSSRSSVRQAAARPRSCG